MNKDTIERAVDYIKQWFSEKYEEGDVPGMVVAVSHQGDMLMNEAYGYADVENEKPMEPGHVFRVASHSKTFTATAIMLLVEEGRLRLDDVVVDYIPWLKEHEDDRWMHVTLRQLLSHGAGVIRDGVDADYWQLERAFPDEERFIEEMMETSLILDNNIKMKYSNYGYTLLGMVIERVTGVAYDTFVMERIVQPLGMRNTFPDYYPEKNQPAENQLVTGYARYERGGRLPIEAISTHVMAAATGFCSTTEDLCTYLNAHMIGSGKLLSDESKKAMQRAEWPSFAGRSRDTDTAYGLGFFLSKYGKQQTFGHSGGFPGCITRSMANGEDGIVVSVLTNAIDGPAEQTLSSIYNIINYFDAHLSNVAEHGLTRFEGSYVSLWAHIHILAEKDHLISVPAGIWDPFAATEKLMFVEDDTFRITETGSGGLEGELVHFHEENGRVKHMMYQGKTFWPKADWDERMKDSTKVRL